MFLPLWGPLQGQRLVTPADLLRVRAVSRPVISPDGRWVAFELLIPSDPDSTGSLPEKDIRLIATTGKKHPQTVAGSRAQGSFPGWSPDGNYLSFLAEKGGKGKNELFLYSLKNKVSKKAFCFPVSVSSYRWLSPTRIAFLATDTAVKPPPGGAIIVGKERKNASLWEADLTTGKIQRITTGEEHVMAFDYAPGSKMIVLRIAPSSGDGDTEHHSSLILMDRQTKERTVLGGKDGIFSLDHAWGTPRWSPDGRWIASFVKVKTAYLPVLFSAAEGRGRVLAEEYHGTIWYLDWNPVTDELFFSSNEGVQGIFGKIDVSTEQITVLGKVNRSYSEVQNWSFSADGRWVAYQDVTHASPDDVWLMRADGTQKRRLTVMNPHLSGIQFGEQKVVHWKSYDGQQIEGVLILPPGYDPSRRYPLVVQVHGGPLWAWWNGYLANWHEWAQLLAANGFVVLYPNPRGSNGYGWRFALENLSDWGGGDYKDILSGVDYLVREGIADSSRLGIGGWSYGGFMTAWAVGHTSRFKAAVMGASVTDLVTMYSTSGRPENFSLFMGGKPYGDTLSRYRDHSPVTFVEKATTPTLILHGEKDPIVPLTQSYEFYQGLVDHKVTCEFVTYPREGHNIAESVHQKDMMERIIKWFSRYLKE